MGDPYELVAADGSKQIGGGEGGSIFRCRFDGSDLQRYATGLWNPFGMVLRPRRSPLDGWQRSGCEPALSPAPDRRRRRLRISVSLRTCRHPSAAIMERRATWHHAHDGREQGRLPVQSSRSAIACGSAAGETIASRPTSWFHREHRGKAKQKSWCKVMRTFDQWEWRSPRMARST